jgi:hypothetical protein
MPRRTARARTILADDLSSCYRCELCAKIATLGFDIAQRPVEFGGISAAGAYVPDEEDDVDEDELDDEDDSITIQISTADGILELKLDHIERAPV